MIVQGSARRRVWCRLYGQRRRSVLFDERRYYDHPSNDWQWVVSDRTEQDTLGGDEEGLSSHAYPKQTA